MKRVLMLTIWVSLVIGVIPTVKAQCVGDSLPPEVRALIGMKLPPKGVNMAPASIPRFFEVNGALLVDSGEKADSVLAYAEGLFEGKWPIFLLERIYHPDRTMEILDARVLPANLLDWRLVNGKPERNSGHFRLSERCRVNDKDERVILGLVKPEHGKEYCAHFSKRVKQAWHMDMKSGCLAPIATQGLQCEYITMNDCY